MHFQASVPSAMDKAGSGGTLSGGFERDKARTLTVPAGTVLAYQVIEVLVNNEGNY